MKKPLLWRFLFLSTILLIVSIYLPAQEPPHFSAVARALTSQQSSNGMGAGIWVVIALIFSFMLHYFIWQSEKQPDDIWVENAVSVATQFGDCQQRDDVAVLKTTSDTARKGMRGKKQYRHKQLLHTSETLHLVKNNRSKPKAAS